MRRINNLHEKICNIDNINLADRNARKNKKCKKWIQKHDLNQQEENLKLSEDLLNLRYKTSEYRLETIYEPKERLLYKLPYYPDRITHHAILNILEPIWTKLFIANTYSCIKGRGIHKCAKDVRKTLVKDPEGTKYCLKLDVRKYYPSIDHDILKQIIRRKIKDSKLLKVLDEIIDSADGVPIGNYLSQFFANLYLTYFDHWVKEELRIKYYFRYADDLVIFSNDKNKLRSWFCAIKLYLKHVLKLELKSNYQIFDVDTRGVDFVGYVFYHTHVALRKSIKQRMFKTISKTHKNKLPCKLASYYGWTKYCNSHNLLNTIKSKTGLYYSDWIGKQVTYRSTKNKNICIYDIIKHNKYYVVNFTYKNKSYFYKRNNINLLFYLLQECSQEYTNHKVFQKQLNI